MTRDQPLTSIERPASKQPRRPVSRASLETLISRAVAVFGIAFGAQSLPAVLSQREHLQPSYWLASTVVVYALLVICFVCSMLGRWVKPVTATFAVVFVAVLVFWLPGIDGEVWGSADRPWPWFMMTVAAAAATVAFPFWAATTYLVLSSLLYGVVRVLPQGGSAPLSLVSLDVVYAVLLGGAVLIIITMLRSAAAAVDAAQATALGRYLDAVREHATEVERVQVDSIVHDTVLTAFLSAARAETPEQRELAAKLASNAIIHLREAEAAAPDDHATVDARTITERIEEAQSSMPRPFVLETELAAGTMVPSVAADALVSAAVQAMVNSSQHAGDGAARVERWVRVTSSDRGVRVEVGDNGRGFAMGDIPEERLGVRVSIIERMLGVGGGAHIESAPGHGSLVTVTWPAVDPELDRALIEESDGEA